MDLFLYLEEQHRSGKLGRSLAVELALQHKPDPGDLRLREGYDCERTITLLKDADEWLVSAEAHDESFEALAGAAFIYTAFVDATAGTTRTWWSVHATVYSVLTGVLEEEFGLRVDLDRKRQRRLYEEAIATAQRLGSNGGPLDSVATDTLLMLLKTYRRFVQQK